LNMYQGFSKVHHFPTLRLKNQMRGSGDRPFVIGSSRSN
jgi:hypothetical protein